MSIERQKRPYVEAMDLVRAVTIVSVVFVHATWFTANGGSSPIAGFVLNWMHFTRESFMALTGFVLTYTVFPRPRKWVDFFKKRYRLVLFPYLIWSALYLALKMPIWPLSGYLGQWLRDLPTGAAWFHLYYLLVTMQFYLILPVFFIVMHWAKRFPWRVLAGALLFEALLMTYDQYWVYGHGQGINGYTGMEFWSYLWYFVLGGTLALHWPRVSEWIRSHTRILVTGLMASAGLSALIYGIEWHVTGNVNFADSVLQPSMIPFATLLILNLISLGLRYQGARQRSPGRFQVVHRISDLSFGIYLVHPMLMAGWLYVWGQWHAVINPWVLDIFTVILVVSASMVLLGRLGRTALSPWFIGRTASLVKGTAVSNTVKHPQWTHALRKAFYRPRPPV